ncbi:DUF2147 domain-containing protein [Spirosoma sp. RP8]|uniref:DUF2147 domain-containing protein n=1 Tax=Spirosoma liriopis TaxID=2937440 RepID=A0ABT0HQV1_9BACT|nr:DUF2147 domain-containing protein [Spirosoma liriopis]MCK8494548.1 DUF2147 domain-containing protein [Spirosoma liriopis]
MNPCRLVIFVFLCLLTLSAYAPLPDNPDAVEGKWLSARKKNQVQIFKQGNKYFGRIVWMAEPNDPETNRPKTDRENPDEKLRNRPLLNLVIMTNLTYKGNNVWTDGQIYNPEDGKTYSCDLTLKDPNSLDLHGYVMGIPLLGKTKTWTRVR